MDIDFLQRVHLQLMKECVAVFTVLYTLHLKKVTFNLSICPGKVIDVPEYRDELNVIMGRY